MLKNNKKNFCYNKYIITSFICVLLKKGGKESSENNFKNVLANIKKITKKNPFSIFLTALKNAKPYCEVKTVKIAGMNYKIPTEININRQKTFALKWIINNSRSNANNTIKYSLTKEIIDTYNLTSKTIKTCDEFHKVAESNKIFIQIRY